jgi:hypothetical protein
VSASSHHVPHSSDDAGPTASTNAMERTPAFSTASLCAECGRERANAHGSSAS